MPQRIKSKNITFGYTCNNNCVHCIIGYKARKRFNDRNTEEVKKAIEKAKEENAEQVIFIGGEITIRKDFFELLEFAKKLGLKIHIETNGRIFAIKEFAKKTMKIDPELSVMVSFHSPIEEIQDKITRVKGSFKQTIAGIKNLKKFGLKDLQTDTVISKLNYEQLPQLVKFFKDLKVDEAHLTLMRIGGNALENLNYLYVSPKEIQPYLFKAIEIGEKIGQEVKTYGFPYCWINGFEKHAYEQNFIQTFKENKTYVFDELHGEIDWQKERIAIKSKLPTCTKCKYFNICEGVWREYLTLKKEMLVPII